MELIPIGQGLKTVLRPEPADRGDGLFVSQPGRVARDGPLEAAPPPLEAQPTTHPVLDLIYRPDIRRAIEEAEPPQQVRQYPEFDQTLGKNVGNFLNVII